MQSKTTKLIGEERVMVLLECYGADSDNWPEEERAAAAALIKSSTELQQRQRETMQLDKLMGVAQVRESLDTRANAQIVAHIIDALPEQPPDIAISLRDRMEERSVKQRSVKQRSVKQRSWWLAYGAAAAAMVLLAVSVVMQQSFEPLQPTGTTPSQRAAVAESASQEEMDQWMWQQATGLSEDLSAELVPDDADLPVTFMAMVELDMLPSDE